MPHTIRIQLETNLSTTQSIQVSSLQQLAFDNLSVAEAEEDFYHPESAHVLAYSGDTLLAWAGVHIESQTYLGRRIKIGGYGICTHPDWQGKGIASKVASQAMVYLKDHGCDIGFLSVDPTNQASLKLHSKFGFIPFTQPFSWTNNQGILKQDTGAMIAPINSLKIFEFVHSQSEPLYIGHGYW